MAAVSFTLCEEQFLCSICLEVFTDPVTTSCGHSFCCICINRHWDCSVRCSCPVCKHDFRPKPQLKVNTILAEMVSQFRYKSQDEDTGIEAQSTAPGEVLCDLCPKPRLRALKSCLVCLLSYCESHLQPHLTNPRLKRHHLIHPLPNLEEHICPEHQWPLELFCRDHSLLVCLKCTAEEHRDHQTVSLKEQGEDQLATLKLQIKERRVKVQEIQRSVEQSQRKADAEIQEGLRVFTALLERVQQSADSFKQSIREKHQKVEEEASQLIEQIQTEISELEQRGAEMEQLWTSGDHLSFVQTFTTVKPAPQLSDWSQKTVRTPSYKGTGAQAVSELSGKLNMEMEAFFEVEFEKAQEFAVEVSLDPKTAHPDLVLSKDLKQVYDCDQTQTLPDNPERFTYLGCVLGKQKFSSGKFYFEVQVKEKTSWEVGVVKESVDRKAEEDSLTVQKGYWTLNLDDDYKTSDDPPVIISVKGRPKKVGVFVDYDEGLVSFYDVDKESFLYSFTDCCFTENILPFFDPHGDSAPMVLKPVRQLVQHYKK
ncbi:unnamed protein product [Knipowitschia caucasica]|uniref:Uncharacterized protein n=3 Tax=Knipowitschia caucasica TaxID=637954 RepID=A0AAV2LTN6_KNICA